MTWFGSGKLPGQAREETVWEDLAEYLKGGKLPAKRLPKTTLDQFALEDGLLYFVREKADGSLHYSLIVPRSLVNSAIQHAHELSDHLGQKKTMKRQRNSTIGQTLKLTYVHM